MTVEVDHLVVVARTLDEGAAWCEATLGVPPGPGGRHALMGTHNRLLCIASAAFARTYLEIIAVDPAAPAPGRARWFGMDAVPPAPPRLVHWVARTAALDRLLDTLQAAGLDAGRALAASRPTPSGLLQWRIAVRDDGTLGSGGALPTLIEWGERHPADAMPPCGVRLRALTLRGLPPHALRLLEGSGVRAAPGDAPAVEAEFETPRGIITVASA